jgi:hypothetical protein
MVRKRKRKSSSSSALQPFVSGLAAWTQLFLTALRRSHPEFRHVIQYNDPALTEGLFRLALDEGMFCAPFEVYSEKKEEWLRDLNRVLDDLPKCVDFISVATDLDLDFRDGSLEFVSFGYAGRFSRAWGPRPQVRRTVGDAVWAHLWLRGGGAGGGGSDAGFDGVAGGVGGLEDVAGGGMAEDDGAGEVLSDVEELGSDDVDDDEDLVDAEGDVDAVGRSLRRWCCR